MIRADFDLLAEPRSPHVGERAFGAASAALAAQGDLNENPRSAQPFRTGGRRSRPGRGRAEGQGRATLCLPPGPGSRCSTHFLRAEPPPAGALRARLALQSAAASAKLLRLNADEAALRDLRFAVGDPGGPAANLLSLWRDGAGRPPSLDPSRIFDAAARLDLAVDPNGLAAGLKACAGEGDPVSAAAKAAALAFCAVPDAPAAPSEILALWVLDRVIAIRLRWPRPVPLIAAKILDPTLRSPGASRRSMPNDPAWPNVAAGAIALAATSALDLAADLSRRSNILIAVALQTPLQTGTRKSSTSCSPEIASRPQKPPATRR